MWVTWRHHSAAFLSHRGTSLLLHFPASVCGWRITGHASDVDKVHAPVPLSYDALPYSWWLSRRDWYSCRIPRRMLTGSREVLVNRAVEACFLQVRPHRGTWSMHTKKSTVDTIIESDIVLIFPCVMKMNVIYSKTQSSRGNRMLYLETFQDETPHFRSPSHFRANWGFKVMGQGRGKSSRRFAYAVPRYPLRNEGIKSVVSLRTDLGSLATQWKCDGRKANGFILSSCAKNDDK